MKILYKTKAKAVGGRDGHVETEDGTLRLDLSIPKSLGGPGKAGATNPEQLFASGYAACFESAIMHVGRMKKIAIPGLVVEAEVGLVPAETGFALIVSLFPTFQGVTADVANELVGMAHKVCPYSNAVQGNIDVQITTTVA